MCSESNASFSLVDCGPAIPAEAQFLFCTVWISSAVLSSRAAPELFPNAVPSAASQMWLFGLNRVVEIAILSFFPVPTQGLTSCCWLMAMVLGRAGGHCLQHRSRFYYMDLTWLSACCKDRCPDLKEDQHSKGLQDAGNGESILSKDAIWWVICIFTLEAELSTT